MIRVRIWYLQVPVQWYWLGISHRSKVLIIGSAQDRISVVPQCIQCHALENQVPSMSNVLRAVHTGRGLPF